MQTKTRNTVPGAGQLPPHVEWCVELHFRSTITRNTTVKDIKRCNPWKAIRSETTLINITMGAFEISDAINGRGAKVGAATAVEDLKTTNASPTSPAPRVSSDDDFAVLSLRNFLFDICNQNGGGHGGSALGMAAIGVALYKYIMRYNPGNSEWFDRDRFVLSNGKCCLTDARSKTAANFRKAMRLCSCTP